MKILYPDCITGIAADEEDAEYPVENLLNDIPKQVWRATSVDAKVTLTVSAGSSVFIANTNATRIDFTLKVAGETVETAGLHIDKWGNAWLDYTAQTGEHTIELDFESTEIVEAGIARAAVPYEFASQDFSFKEGLKTRSIVKEWNAGGKYIKFRPPVRVFTMSFFWERSTEIRALFDEILRQVGEVPLPWLIDSGQLYDWPVFVSFPNLPEATHDTPSYGVVSATLEES